MASAAHGIGRGGACSKERPLRASGPLRSVRCAAGRRRQRGFSLVEIIIVIALMAALTGVVVAGTGALAGSRLRAAATVVMGSVRLAVTEANSTGEATRVVFDFEQRRVVLERAQGRMLRTGPDDEEGGPQAGAEASTDFEREAEEYASELLDGPKAPRARFRPSDRLRSEDGQPGRALGRGVRFIQVQTEHDEEPRLEGRAYLYVWPGGTAEQAAVQVGRVGQPDSLTVLVSGLTGRAHLERGRVELEAARSDERFGDREDE